MAEMAWVETAVFEDNDVSASTDRPRPAYGKLLEAIRTRSVDAVVVWDLDRLTRRPSEIEEFIVLADEFKVGLASVGGDLDLATDNGRLYARIKGAVARAEVERKSARQKAANVQRAELGLPPAGGRRLFGYEADGMAVVDEEAELVRWSTEQILAGVPVRTVVRGLTERGSTTSQGRPWSPSTLKGVLKNPRYAGLRVHRGVIVGPGTWPAILDEETHRSVVALLKDPSRRRAGRPRSHLLTGLARCGVCGERIYGVSEPRGVTYYCSTRRHVARRGDEVESFVRSLVVGRLGKPDARALFTQSSSTERRELLQQEGQIRAKLDALALAFAEGEIDGEQLRAGTSRLRQKLSDVHLRLGSTTPVPFLQLGDPVVGVDAIWDGLSLDVQREVISVLFDVVLHPVGRGCRVFRPESIEIRWSDGAAA